MIAQMGLPVPAVPFHQSVGQWRRRAVPVLAVVLYAAAAPGSSAFAQAACDRSCLETTLNQYLTAIVKHDPADAPLFVAFRQTENAVVIPPGSGVWKSVTALGKVQRRYMDPVSGQAGYFGTVEESGKPAIVTVRVKVENRQITEAEWIIAREGAEGPNGPGGNLYNPDALAANPPPERTLPRNARTSRAALIAVANSYFDGLTSKDGSVVMHHPGCTRIENGTTMTGRAAGAGRGGAGRGGAGGRGGAPAAPQAPAGRNLQTPGSTDCAAGFERSNILPVARRYPIADEEAGVVLGLVVFMRPPGSPMRRNLLSEWFIVDDNKIRSIYAAMYYPPADAPAPNWPPYDLNWPSPALPPPAAPAAGRGAAAN